MYHLNLGMYSSEKYISKNIHSNYFIIIIIIMLDIKKERCNT